MPEIIRKEITVYKFNELRPDAQNRAISEWAEHGLHDEWWDSVYEQAKEDGKARGFEIDDIRFSGFWSQGDGASWTGRVRAVPYLDWKLASLDPTDNRFGPWTVLRELAENRLLIATIEISRGGGMYVHEMTMRCDADSSDYGSTDPDDHYLGDEPMTLDHGVLAGASIPALLDSIDFNDAIDRLIEEALDDARDYARDIYKMLGKEYEWLISHEHFAEIAEINDWRFDEDGRIV